MLPNLSFIISLIDHASGPAGAMANNLDNITNRIQNGFRNIGYGVAGLAGTGLALNNLLEPTKEMQAALASVESLDVAKDGLSALSKVALDFSMQYGESAAEFVRSSYDIKGAIDSLTDAELPAFTRAAAIVAKGTKANVGDITSYLGTMYGIFKDTAETMGKSAWVDQLAGQTALAVKIFKTDGAGISQAFTTLGAAATAANVPLAEQMGVMGKLLATMGGGEAGTRYRAFLNGALKAQDDLGLKFTDSQKHMLPMVDILGKIKSKLGDLSTDQNKMLLSKAFGSDEAVAALDLLVKDIDGLGSSIDQIGKQKGMANAVEMAKIMTMPWDRAAQGMKSLQIILGTQLMPQINWFFDKFNAGVAVLSRWSNLFPELSHGVSIAVLGVFGLVAAVSVLSIAIGLAMLLSGGFLAIWAIISSPIVVTTALIAYLGYGIWKFIGAMQELIAKHEVFEKVFGAWDAFKAAVDGAIEFVMGAFESLKSWLANFNLFEFLLSGVDLLIGKVNQLTGMRIDVGGGVAPPVGLSPNAGTVRGGGGLVQKISSASNSNQRNIGTVNINNYESKRTLSQLVDDVMMAGG